MLHGIAILAGVTFSNPPARLETLLPALGKSMGRDLQAGSEIQNEVGLLEVTEVEPTVLLAKIADAFGGEWEEEGKVLRLRRPILLRTKLAKEASRLWTARLLAALPKAPPVDDRTAPAYVRRIKALQKSAPGMNENARVRALWHDLPAESLGLPALVRSLPLGSLMGMDGRTVFSDFPSAMQRGLARPMVRNTYRAHDAIRTAALADPFAPAEDPSGADARHWFGDGDVPGARVVFGFQRAGAEAITDFRMFAADGRTLRSERIGYPLAFGRTDLPKAVLSVLPRPLKLGALGSRWLEIWHDTLAIDRKGQRPITEAEKAWALDPAAHEPLAKTPVDGLRSLAREADLDLVALLSDADPSQGISMEPKPTYGSVIDALQREGARFEESEGWLTVRPTDPEQTRQKRIDRAALGRWLRLASERFLTFDEAAKMAHDTLPDGFYGSTMGSDTTFLLSRQRLGIWNDPELVAAYGALTDTERRRLAHGEAIPWSRTSLPARRALELALFRRYSPLWSDYKEPTDVFPRGIPADLMVFAKVEDHPRLLLEPWPSGTDPQLAQTRDVDGWVLTQFLRNGVAIPAARPATDHAVSLVLTSSTARAEAPLGAVLWSDVAKPPEMLDRVPKAYLTEMLGDAMRRFSSDPERYKPLQKLIHGG